MQTDLIKVTGMSCGGCASKIMQALKVVSSVCELKNRSDQKLNH